MQREATPEMLHKNPGLNAFILTAHAKCSKTFTQIDINIITYTSWGLCRIIIG